MDLKDIPNSPYPTPNLSDLVMNDLKDNFPHYLVFFGLITDFHPEIVKAWLDSVSWDFYREVFEKFWIIMKKGEEHKEAQLVNRVRMLATLSLQEIPPRSFLRDTLAIALAKDLLNT